MLNPNRNRGPSSPLRENQESTKATTFSLSFDGRATIAANIVSNSPTATRRSSLIRQAQSIFPQEHLTKRHCDLRRSSVPEMIAIMS
jgi:hypothetical protein